MTLFTEISFTNESYSMCGHEKDDGFEIVLTQKQSKIVVLKCTATNTDLFENCVQLDIYRNDDHEYSEALRDTLKSLIFDEILTKHSIMISELQQTATSSRIFGYCLTRAIAAEMHVYHVKNNVITRIYDKNQLEERAISIIECTK